MGSGGEKFLLGLMVLFLGVDELFEVDLVDFEEGGFEFVELGSFFEEVLDFFESRSDLLRVFVGDLGLDWVGGLFSCRFSVDLCVFFFDDLL
jgi:hypothetical protein